LKENLYRLAKEYIELIETIEKTHDVNEAQCLEAQRVELHGLFMDLLDQQGIMFKDRDHATRIAVRIVNGEL
jgi:hypothetical protein